MSELLVTVLFVGGWGCRASSSCYQEEEELSWYMWLRMSPKLNVPQDWGGPSCSSCRPGLAPASRSAGPAKEDLSRQVEGMRLAATPDRWRE